MSGGVPIGMVGVAAGSSGYVTRYWHSTYHALSSLLGSGRITGWTVLALANNSLEDIMLPNYSNPDCSLCIRLCRLLLMCL